MVRRAEPVGGHGHGLLVQERQQLHLAGAHHGASVDRHVGGVAERRVERAPRRLGRFPVAGPVGDEPDPCVAAALRRGRDEGQPPCAVVERGVVLDDAGLARPESQQATSADQFIREISQEEIALADGDHLFYTVFDNGEMDATRQLIEANPLWANLGAVQAGHAYEVPDETWMSAVGVFGAHSILDDLAAGEGVPRKRPRLPTPLRGGAGGGGNP